MLVPREGVCGGIALVPSSGDTHSMRKPALHKTPSPSSHRAYVVLRLANPRIKCVLSVLLLPQKECEQRWHMYQASLRCSQNAGPFS